MDKAMRITTNNFLHLFIVLYCAGVSSFTVEIGVVSGPSSSSSSASTTFSTAKVMSSRLSSAQSAEITGTQLMPWLGWGWGYSPLTGIELRNLVVEAALKEERYDEGDDFLDVPGIAWMEHINLIVGHTSEDRQIAKSFYIDVMGLTPDKGKSFHVNMGRQQFHLATPKEDDEIPHRIHGSFGLVVPDLDTLWERLQIARKDYDGANNYGFRDNRHPRPMSMGKCLSLFFGQRSGEQFVALASRKIPSENDQSPFVTDWCSRGGQDGGVERRRTGDPLRRIRFTSGSPSGAGLRLLQTNHPLPGVCGHIRIRSALLSRFGRSGHSSSVCGGPSRGVTCIQGRRTRHIPQHEGHPYLHLRPQFLRVVSAAPRPLAYLDESTIHPSRQMRHLGGRQKVANVAI
jgi:hypothetical protein